MRVIESTILFTPPTVTAQQKGVQIINGKPHFYEKPGVKQARTLLMNNLIPLVPDEPIDGPIKLHVKWNFYSKSHKPHTRRTTRPDTDNLQKLLKDVMTDMGFWKDDSLVCDERVEKWWEHSYDQGLYIRIEELEE